MLSRVLSSIQGLVALETSEHLWTPPPVSMVALERKASQLFLLRAPSQKNEIPLVLGGNMSFFFFFAIKTITLHNFVYFIKTPSCCVVSAPIPSSPNTD